MSKCVSESVIGWEHDSAGIMDTLQVSRPTTNAATAAAAVAVNDNNNTMSTTIAPAVVQSALTATGSSANMTVNKNSVSNRSSRATSPCRATAESAARQSPPAVKSRQSSMTTAAVSTPQRTIDEFQAEMTNNNNNNINNSSSSNNNNNNASSNANPNPSSINSSIKSSSLTRNQSPSSARRSRDRDRACKQQQQQQVDDSFEYSHHHQQQQQHHESLYTDDSQTLDESKHHHHHHHHHQAIEDLDGPNGTPLFYPNQSLPAASAPPQLVAAGQSHTLPSRMNSCQALDRLNTKIACTKESIRKEQTSRDDNVNEYLKLAANADKQQLHRIKAVFEKKNQKSAHTISQLQKKLESYSKRVKDLHHQTVQQQYHQQQQQQQQMGYKQPREMLRDVGQGLKNVGGNIRDGITGLGGSVMSKPREFAHLIKNKFGSADNINQLSAKWYTDPDLNALNLTAGMEGAGTSTPQTMAGPGSGSGGANGAGKFHSENGSECSSVTSDSIPPGSGKNHSSSGLGAAAAATTPNVGSATPGAPHAGERTTGSTALLKSLMVELQERREDCDKLRTKVERVETLQKEVADLTLALDSERYRAERLEEQINDLTELHQNEIENLKQTMADMEEKVQYQSDERLRDVHEVLENCQTRITKMEHLSQQQYVTVEGIDNSNARALVVKLINVVLTILQVVLLLVATAAGIIMPFLKTRIRVLTTLFFILFTIFVIRQWPDVRDIGSHMVRHLKESLMVK